jgi:hypothetical protein
VRTLTIAVVEESDQAHDAFNKFMGTRHAKNKEHVLFIWNIGEIELDGKDFKADPHVLMMFNNPNDLITLKPYGKDYKTAFADAMTVAQQMVGVECELPKFYNFFSKPKVTLYSEYKNAMDKSKQ